MQKIIHLMINGVNYKCEKQLITGLEIKQIGKIDLSADLFLQAKGNNSDRLIQDNDQIDLSLPGIEKFYSKENMNIIILVNTREHMWTNATISYDDLVLLAFNKVENNKAYTITFSNGPIRNPEGFVVKRQSVFVSDKMIFNVTGTNQS